VCDTKTRPLIREKISKSWSQTNFWHFFCDQGSVFGGSFAYNRLKRANERQFHTPLDPETTSPETEWRRLVHPQGAAELLSQACCQWSSGVELTTRLKIKKKDWEFLFYKLIWINLASSLLYALSMKKEQRVNIRGTTQFFLEKLDSTNIYLSHILIRIKMCHWLPRTHTFLFFSFLAVSGDSDLNRNPARRKQNRRQFPRSQGCPGHEFYHLDILGIMWKQTSGCYLRAPLHWNEVGEKEQRAKCNSLGIDDEGPGSIPRLQLRSRVLSHAHFNEMKWV
jgi:hypothetical protein